MKHLETTPPDKLMEAALKEDVKEYINFYNHKRFHESLQYKKPMEVYFNSMKTDKQNYSSKQISVA